MRTAKTETLNSCCSVKMFWVYLVEIVIRELCCSHNASGGGSVLSFIFYFWFFKRKILNCPSEWSRHSQIAIEHNFKASQMFQYHMLFNLMLVFLRPIVSLNQTGHAFCERRDNIVRNFWSDMTLDAFFPKYFKQIVHLNGVLWTHLYSDIKWAPVFNLCDQVRKVALFLKPLLLLDDSMQCESGQFCMQSINFLVSILRCFDSFQRNYIENLPRLQIHKVSSILPADHVWAPFFTQFVFYIYMNLLCTIGMRCE